MLPPAVPGNSRSISLAEDGGRDVKGLSVTLVPGLDPDNSDCNVDNLSEIRPELGASAVDLRPR